jgi:hypothetical protein
VTPGRRTPVIRAAPVVPPSVDRGTCHTWSRPAGFGQRSRMSAAPARAYACHRVGSCSRSVGPTVPSSGEGFKNPNHAAQRYSWIRPPSTSLRSFDRRPGSPPDLRCSVTGGHGQAQSPMWSLRHVVRDVRPEHSLEVPTTVDQDVVEAPQSLHRSQGGSQHGVPSGRGERMLPVRQTPNREN